MFLPGFEVDCMEQNEQGILIQAHTTGSTAWCPRCEQASSHVHSTYCRYPRDLPISEQAVYLKLRVRRFRCRNCACPQRIFVERLPDLLPVHAQRTQRLTQTLRDVGFALGGEPGKRLLRRLRMRTSPRTLLRIMRQRQDVRVIAPCVLGVDDWAIRKGCSYGTILVDLERQCPIDLLSGRDAETLSRWLHDHPGIAVIARDRSTEYIRGATTGAPAAVQVADRWHLLHNLRQMLERCLSRRRSELQLLPLLSPDPNPQSSSQMQLRAGPFQRSTPEREASAASHARWSAVHQEVQRLRSEGHNILQIARLLQLERKTVRKYFYLEQFSKRAKHRARPSILDPYLPYLLTRCQEGCTNGMQLWREICEQGYGGTYGQVIRWLRRQRLAATVVLGPANAEATDTVIAPSVAPAKLVDLPSNRALSWLFMQDRETQSAADATLLHSLRQHPVVEQIYQLTQQFKTMVQQRQVFSLDPWLEACSSSQVSDLQTFAAGLTQDYAAVRAALELAWSNGQTEGHINRLKLLKRQMYGRAKLDLLRLRLLHPI